MALAHCSLRSMRTVEVVGARKNGRTRGRHAHDAQANCQCEFVRNI